MAFSPYCKSLRCNRTYRVGPRRRIHVRGARRKNPRDRQHSRVRGPCAVARRTILPVRFNRPAVCQCERARTQHGRVLLFANPPDYNPFRILCDALWASNDVIYPNTIIGARRRTRASARLPQSNRLRVFYRGINYSDVMGSKITRGC